LQITNLIHNIIISISKAPDPTAIPTIAPVESEDVSAVGVGVDVA
jgi:hypothetical protein